MSDIAYNLPNQNKREIVGCLYEAIGDDLKGCLRREKIEVEKSDAAKLLKWDFINRNFINRFLSGRMTAKYARRGGWYMVPLYDEETKTLFTVMREDRFYQLQRQQSNRRAIHYMDALTSSFNFDLNTNGQLSLFNEPQFADDEIQKVVEGILKEFGIKGNVIKRYATILFEEYNLELVSVRCCILDSSLQIVEQENWSEYINNSESVIVDEIRSTEQSERPQIKLKAKAKAKIGQRELVAVKEEKTIQKVQNK